MKAQKFYYIAIPILAMLAMILAFILFSQIHDEKNAIAQLCGVWQLGERGPKMVFRQDGSGTHHWSGSKPFTWKGDGKRITVVNHNGDKSQVGWKVGDNGNTLILIYDNSTEVWHRLSTLPEFLDDER